MGDENLLKVVYAGCTESGLDICRSIHKEVVEVSEIVTLDPDMGDKYEVSGYESFEPFAEKHDIDVHIPRTYSMESETDIHHFQRLEADILLVHGWQRLIPEEILRTFTYGAFGLHGSAYGLPKGRGRSPMNWSLINGLNRFLLSAIHLDEGPDSGAVVSTRKYDINQHDTIRTLYYKLTVAGVSLFEDCISNIQAGELDYEEQNGEPTYYPKRTPEDGVINWEDPTDVIHRLVRAVTEPYPGAFTEQNKKRIYIWKAQPFSDDFSFDAEPGEIVQVFSATEDFVVNTPDGSLLVTDWDAKEWKPKKGRVFDSNVNESIGSPSRFDRPDHKDNLTGK